MPVTVQALLTQQWTVADTGSYSAAAGIICSYRAFIAHYCCQPTSLHTASNVTLSLGVRNSFFFSARRTKIMYALLTSPMRAASPAHTGLLNLLALLISNKNVNY
jgi:hypothetical protein